MCPLVGIVDATQKSKNGAITNWMSSPGRSVRTTVQIEGGLVLCVIPASIISPESILEPSTFGSVFINPGDVPINSGSSPGMQRSLSPQRE